MHTARYQISRIVVSLSVLMLLSAQTARAVPGQDVPRDSTSTTGLIARGGEDCGANCLYALARLMGRTVSRADVRAALPGVPGKGCSLQEIAAAGKSIGLTLEARRLSDDEVLAAPVPYILHLDFTDDGGMGHFVVVYYTDVRGVTWKSLRVIGARASNLETRRVMLARKPDYARSHSRLPASKR